MGFYMTLLEADIRLLKLFEDQYRLEK
jgi:hypothetical protein